MPSQQPWRSGAPKPPRPTTPRDLAAEDQNLNAAAEAKLLERDQKQRINMLEQQLLQANARISMQLQALDDAAEAIDRGHAAEMRAATLETRCEALEAELRVVRRQYAEASTAVQMRDEAWQYHHSLEAAIHANAEAAETSNASRTADVNSMKDELTAAQERTASTVEALEEANAKADKYLAEKQEAENARKSIDARCVALQSENEHLRQAMSDSRLREREWRKERSKILAELDKNTSSAILRREELYFTRTSLLKEQLRLRGELEKKPLPDPEPQVLLGTEASPRQRQRSPSGRGGGGGGSMLGKDAPPTPKQRQKMLEKNPESPRQRRLHTPTNRPQEPPPSTYVHGLVPRSPRSLDSKSEFAEEVLLEYRAAARAKEIPEGPPAGSLNRAIKEGGY